MAMRGRPLDVPTIRRIRRAVENTSIKRAAREVGVSRNTVRKYARPPRRS